MHEEFGQPDRGRRTPPNTNDPQHWRDRAAQMRALARTMADPKIAILMADLAADYDKLADCAALKANSLPNDDCRSGRS
jgi:hypothetical protein